MRFMAVAASLFAASALLIGETALSAPVQYVLGDHEDASLYKANNDNPYGVRIDSADPGGTGPTFSVGTNLGGLGGPVILEWDDAFGPTAIATITGTAERNDDGTFWSVSYTMTGLIGADFGGFKANGTGSGVLTEIGGMGRVIDIDSLADGEGVIFEFDNDGHRLPTSDGWVGRGWLLDNGATDDWLVTGTIVPVPPAAWLFGSALGLLGFVRGRMRNSA